MATIRKLANKNRKKRQRIKASILVNKYKYYHPCIECQEDNLNLLTFHYRNKKTKINTISAMVNRGTSLKTIKNEIKKCDILCMLCRREEDNLIKRSEVL